jgi:signal transduction histidine kinase
VILASSGLWYAETSDSPRLALVALVFLPAALVHLGLALPENRGSGSGSTPLAVGAYVLAGVLGLFAARGGPATSALGVGLRSLALALVTIAALVLLARLAGWLLGARAAPRLEAGVVLAGAFASLAALVARGAGGPPDALAAVAALALPASIAFALCYRRRPAAVPPRNARAEAHTAISLEGIARGMAHAMLKPVTAVAQQLRLLEDRVSDPGVRKEIEGAAELMEQVQRLVRDVLDLARAQAIAPSRRVSIAALVEQAVRDVRARFPDRLVEMDVCEGALRADEVALRTMLINLLENALEASEASRPVRLRAEHIGDEVRFHVEDRGHGLAPEVRDRLYEPFRTTKPRGTGLGLAIAHEICHAHGGSLEAHPLPEGTLFIAVVPASPE